MALAKLQYISLVSKICQELDNHLGSSDKDIAEFIIDLADGVSLKDFKAKLVQEDPSISVSLAENLFQIIQRMNPKKASDVQQGDTQPQAQPQQLQPSTGGIAEAEVRKEAAQRAAARGSRSRSRSHSPRRHRRRHSRDRSRSRSHGRDRRRRNSRDRSRSRDRHRDRERRRRDDSRDRDHDRAPEVHQVEFRGRHNDSSDVGRGYQIQLYGVYKGKITNVQDFGAFVSLEESVPDGSRVRSKKEGLVHISQMRQGGRPMAVADIVKRNQTVYVKVLSVLGDRLALSMKDVDQNTGQDLCPIKPEDLLPSGATVGPFGQINDLQNPERPTQSGIVVKHDDEARRAAKRLEDWEMWEAKQLRNAGVINDITEDLEWDDDQGIMGRVGEDIEDIEIELNDREPAFLKGHTPRSGLIVSPIKVVRAPDGSLQKSALTQTALAKERRELREQQRNQLLDSIPKDMNRPWVDPMPEHGERQLAQALRGIGVQDSTLPEWKQKSFGQHPTFGKITKVSIKDQREGLPIFKLKHQLVEAVRANQCLVVIGETGSGKTTQITQYLAEDGYCSLGRIGCTQPRRVAATSVAKRVAEEYGCRLGQEVGYAIRFEDCTGPETKIKYMTDGMLLREALVDSDMLSYSIIMLDEAHERTIHTDVLFALLKKLVKRRPELKLIVTSATLDAEKFSSYFYNSPIFTIPGRTYPVEILYTREPESDYLDAALICVMQIHVNEPPGDILLFLTGQEEIDTACQILYERMKKLGSRIPDLIILPIYSTLPSEMQSRIFEPPPEGSRKVIIATNIAETSITVDGIFYVVDPGFVKQKVFNPKAGMDSLVVIPISQAAAKQRAGRAGRTGPGKCYRLYTESAYKCEMLPSSVPEIQRTDLSMTVLTLKAMGITDLLEFDFMDPPPQQTMYLAMEMLYAIGCLDDEGLLTKLGRKMAEFPLSPPLAKMVIASVDLGCSEEILTVTAMLSVQSVFYRPKEKAAQADQKKAKFHQPEGDHLTLLTVYEAWKATKFSATWCFENYVQSRSLRRAQDVRKQLLTIMDRYKLDMISCGKNYNKIRKAITSGFFFHAARKDPQEGYRSLTEQQIVYIHPSSSLYNHNPEWVVYHEVVLTTKEYMREVLAIDPKWLVELAPNFFSSCDPNKLSKRKRSERIEPLYNRFEEPGAWRISRAMRRR
eukprot:TRINITY_DN3062_c0_g1_i1.p1 TRINITY_DN3062_c0_g1~~TRINITY_DN3062_c0_g1_i1.p1  ORF type:complete len:1199 (-),score=212.22 TRINITY_DN3062_c0_g1_i1:104-3628(-)